MTKGENERRKNSEIVKFIKSNICNKDKGEPFVFISYKSDDWEIVLEDVVYRLVKDYGLNIYFDGDFETYNSLWITQFPENMESDNCKGVLAFIDDKYATSYATLLELLYSQFRMDADGDLHPIPVIPVNLDSLHKIVDDRSTGLGNIVFEDGTKNPHAREEQRLFNTIISFFTTELQTPIYLYQNNKERILTKRVCSKFLEEIIAMLNINDNHYNRGDSLDSIKKKIENTFGKDVFRKTAPKQENFVAAAKREEANPDVKMVAEGSPAELSNGRIPLEDFLKKYNNNSFKKSTYSRFRLVGTAGYEKYGTEFFDSAFELTWAFVMMLLREKRAAYIEDVNNRHSRLKNPVFITEAMYEQREDKNKYRKVEVEGLGNYYMYRHYGQYQWIDSVLKPRLIEFGLPLKAFHFEYKGGELAPAAALMEPEPLNQLSEKAETGANGSNSDKSVGITGPISLNGGTVEESAKQIEGRYRLTEFLSKYNNRTFQKNSCKTIRLLGVNGYEKYSTEKYDTARNMVFVFAMKRLDEMGMRYIEVVNSSVKGKNPIFITEEEHRERKARKDSISYKAVTSTEVTGYSFCAHYSEFDWLNSSLRKQLTALGVVMDDIYVELEV